MCGLLGLPPHEKYNSTSEKMLNAARAYLLKRIAGIEAVEQLTRYLERIRLDPAFTSCRGVLVAQVIKPQASVLACARGIACVEVDLAVLRGEREPDLRLFAA